MAQETVNSGSATAAQPVVQRDGASQAGRRQPALDPDYVPVDERSIADLLRFAQQYAKELRYFNEQGDPEGDWSGFLSGNVDDMVSYLRNPKPFQTGTLKSAADVRPHLALLLTFLDLLPHARTQLNELTRRHLESSRRGQQ